MKKAIVALAMIFAVFVGLSVVPNSGTAQAYTVGNSVTNSGYSTSATIVCGYNATGASGCTNVYPGATVWQSTTWNPTQVAVGPYYVSLYRVITSSGYVSGWVGLEGGRYGRWIDVGALQAMWGQGTQVQVIIDGPFY